MKRIAFFGAVLITVLIHWHLAQAGFELNLGRGKAAGFLWSTLIENPRLVAMIFGQFLAICAIYAAFFWLINLLAGPERPAARWYQGAGFNLIATWVAMFWLLLRVHSAVFPHSNWTWMLVPVFDRQATVLGDGVAGLYVVWRVYALSARSVPAFLHGFSSAAMGSGSLRGTRTAKRIASGLAIASLVAIAAGALMVFGASAPETAPDGRASNVIVIGLDSLRHDVLVDARKYGMDNLADLIDTGYLNTNVVSPLARTFPSWVTLLTGENPRVSGARENHMPQHMILRERSIAWDFKRAGYQTVYATDETRFSHIVPEFGFDKIIGPQMGASDFLLGQFGDQPLVNFLVQLPYSELLLPALSANRAFAQAYEPQRFVSRLDTSIGNANEQPLFLAIHLCTAHWPFYVRESNSRYLTVQGREERGWQRYLRMLKLLDIQLGELLSMLETRGYLDEKTLLVVLADHGESLHIDQIRKPMKLIGHGKDLKRFPASLGGHGTSILEPEQWRVFALFRGQATQGKIATGTSGNLASLQDVKPEIKKIMNMDDVEEDFRNEKSVQVEPAFKARPFVSMETAWRPVGLNLQNPQGSEALRIAEASYVILPGGRMELRDEIIDDIIEDKDLGVTDGSRTFAFVRSVDGNFVAVADHASNQVDVYDPEAPPEDRNAIPLLREACSDAELAARIVRWCE